MCSSPRKRREMKHGKTKLHEHAASSRCCSIMLLKKRVCIDYTFPPEHGLSVKTSCIMDGETAKTGVKKTIIFLN